MRLLSVLALTFLGPLSAQQGDDPQAPTFRPEHTSRLPWRHIGPANPTGRITDIAVVLGNRSTWYVASASGGLFKTTDNGTTFTALFGGEATVSLGDVAVAPSNPDIVWVGTGEENARNSVSWGDGVYKSTDGGRNWTHMGLDQTFQIGHIAIHPRNPDIVFVAALGRLWGNNPDRGVFRTLDGGKTWSKVLYGDDRTGCIDVRIDPDDPERVYACLYERKRDAFDGNDPVVRCGEKAGLFRSEDGGTTWQQLTEGLPTCNWGRSALSIYDREPDTLFLMVETERSGWATGSRRAAAPGGRAGNNRRAHLGVTGAPDDPQHKGAVLRTVTADRAGAQAGLQPGDRIVKLGDEVVSNFDDLIEQIAEHEAGDQIELVVARGAAELTLEVTFGTRPTPAARNPLLGSAPFGGRLGGQRANIQTRQGADGFQTGGLFRSDDHGTTWKRINSLTDRPFYYSVIAVDPLDDQNLYSCGVSFYGSFDGGKTFNPVNRGIHVDFHAVWVDPTDSNHVIACCDGGINVSWDRCKTWEVLKGFSAAQYYKITADNSVPYNVYGGLQDNGTWGGPSRTRFSDGITTADWFSFYGGDGFGAAADPEEPHFVFATSQGGAVGMVDLRTGRRSSVRKLQPDGGRARFNWDTPFFLSPHNRLTLYLAGSHAFRAHRYRHLAAGGAPVRQGLQARPISPVLGLTERGTATAFAESPRVEGLLYIGTDDGALWRSDDSGHSWQEFHDQVIGMPGPRYVSHIEPSHHVNDRVYVTFEGHRSDDLNTYVFVSEDRGATWCTLADDLPAREPVHVLREDPRNGNLLFLGTEFSCFASLDRGEHWLAMGAGLPTVSVRDLFIQDRDADLVAGTHGRGAWILDIAPLRRLNGSVAQSAAHLFPPQDAILWRNRSRSRAGHKGFRAANPHVGPTFHLLLADAPEEAPELTIHDVTGEQISTARGAVVAGLQAISWRPRGAGARRRRGPRPPSAGPGTYTVRYAHGDEVLIETFILSADPLDAAGPAAPATHSNNRGS